MFLFSGARGLTDRPGGGIVSENSISLRPGFDRLDQRCLAPWAMAWVPCLCDVVEGVEALVT